MEMLYSTAAPPTGGSCCFVHLLAPQASQQQHTPTNAREVQLLQQCLLLLFGAGVWRGKAAVAVAAARRARQLCGRGQACRLLTLLLSASCWFVMRECFDAGWLCMVWAVQAVRAPHCPTAGASASPRKQPQGRGTKCAARGIKCTSAATHPGSRWYALRPSGSSPFCPRRPAGAVGC